MYATRTQLRARTRDGCVREGTGTAPSGPQGARERGGMAGEPVYEVATRCDGRERERERGRERKREGERRRPPCRLGAKRDARDDREGVLRAPGGGMTGEGGSTAEGESAMEKADGSRRIGGRPAGRPAAPTQYPRSDRVVYLVEAAALPARAYTTQWWRSGVRTRARARRHVGTREYTHTRTHVHTHTRTHARTHAHARAHIGHVYACTPVPKCGKIIDRHAGPRKRTHARAHVSSSVIEERGGTVAPLRGRSILRLLHVRVNRCAMESSR
jgi:hypothetical protein